MTADLLLGRPVAKALQQACRIWISEQLQQGGRPPHLAIIWVGSDPAAERYIGKKRLACQKVGIKTSLFEFHDRVDSAPIQGALKALSESEAVDGILIQLPLPARLVSHLRSFLSLLTPEKDVDGLTVFQQGQLSLGATSGLQPCTAKGILTLLDYYSIPLVGKHAVIVNRSLLVGKPLAQLLLAEHCTVTLAHRKTQNLACHTRQADLLVVATGKPSWLTAAWVKPGVWIVDVGIAVQENGQLVGDVDGKSVAKVAAGFSPVPGGVGPMTVATLLQNVCQAYAMRRGLQAWPSSKSVTSAPRTLA